MHRAGVGHRTLGLASTGAVMCAGAPGSATGDTFPPLWGNVPFNNGAGMARLLFASLFIKTHMPLGAQHGQPQLSDEEACMPGQPRPVKAHTGGDFPARWNKPVDVDFLPCADGTPAGQHRYGPFGPL